MSNQLATTPLANREVCDLIFVDYTNDQPFLTLDYANVTTTELTGESVYAYGGKGHPKKMQFAGEKGGTLTIETQLQSPRLWELITGGTPSKDAKYVKRELFAKSSLDGNIITLNDIPVEKSLCVYTAEDDCGTKLTCEIAGKDVTLPESFTTEKGIVAYYMVSVTTGVERIHIAADSFPKNFRVYGDTIMKSESGEAHPYRFVAYRVAPQSSMSLSFTNNGDPGAVTITCDMMADEDNNMLDLILLKPEKDASSVL